VWELECISSGANGRVSYVCFFKVTRELKIKSTLPGTYKKGSSGNSKNKES